MERHSALVVLLHARRAERVRWEDVAVASDGTIYVID